MDKKDPREKIHLPEDISNPKILELHGRAKNGAKKLTDNRDGRAELGQLAQDYLLALRDLGVGYNARGVSLQAASGARDPSSGAEIPGDLSIYGKPCHPRDAGEKLAAGDTVADLTDLVGELKGKLEYEAGPVVLVPDHKG